MLLLARQNAARLLKVSHLEVHSKLQLSYMSLAEDERLGNELLHSEKDRAEHIMLVDLARNDVNRVCQAKTVKVDHLMQLEKFSHVIHLTSQVSGMLRDGLTRLVEFSFLWKHC